MTRRTRPQTAASALPRLLGVCLLALAGCADHEASSLGASAAGISIGPCADCGPAAGAARAAAVRGFGAEAMQAGDDGAAPADILDDAHSPDDDLEGHDDFPVNGDEGWWDGPAGMGPCADCYILLLVKLDDIELRPGETIVGVSKASVRLSAGDRERITVNAPPWGLDDADGGDSGVWVGARLDDLGKRWTWGIAEVQMSLRLADRTERGVSASPLESRVVEDPRRAPTE